MKPWYRQKTTWSGIGLIVTALSTYLCADTPNVTEIIAMVLNGLAVIFLRQSVKQNGEHDCSAVGLLGCSGEAQTTVPNSPTAEQSNSPR
jgi:hypothetical protein